MRTYITLPDFLTESQIEQAAKLKTAKPITEQIIKPNLKAITEKLGQEVDPLYLGYCCEYVFNEVEKGR